MAESIAAVRNLPIHVKVIGTSFLVFQLLFAANNFGPQRIPGLNYFVTQKWVAPNVAKSKSGDLASRLSDVTPGSGLDAFKTLPFSKTDPTYLEVMVGGVAVADVDNDGKEDVLLTSIPAIDPGDPAGTPTSLFRNLGDGRFQDITSSAGLTGLKGYPQGALFFDYDNDGDADLYIAAYDGGQLFRNDAGAFTDITAAAGLAGPAAVKYPRYTSAAAAGDYDLDGDLDLAIVNNVNWDIRNTANRTEPNLFPVFYEPQASQLFRNNGDGTFTDVTQSSGFVNHLGKGLGVVFADFNDDRYPDLYCSNDISKNTLYLNNKDGTFTETGTGAGVDEVKSSMGISVGDYNNDGKLDLAVSNLKGSMLSLYRNAGDGLFDYVTSAAQLAPSGKTSGWGVEFVDLDLDGFQDLILAGGPVYDLQKAETQNMVFRNMGDGMFVDAGKSSGLLDDKAVSRGLAILDYDNDGCPDILLHSADGDGPQLLRNAPAEKNAHLAIRLEGTKSNREGIGARVQIVRADGMTLTQEVRRGSSYQSTSTSTLFFGLGESTPKEARITWPSGQVDVVPLEGQTNRRLVLREGEPTPAGEMK